MLLQLTSATECWSTKLLWVSEFYGLYPISEDYSTTTIYSIAKIEHDSAVSLPLVIFIAGSTISRYPFVHMPYKTQKMCKIWTRQLYRRTRVLLLYFYWKHFWGFIWFVLCSSEIYVLRMFRCTSLRCVLFCMKSIFISKYTLHAVQLPGIVYSQFSFGALIPMELTKTSTTWTFVREQENEKVKNSFGNEKRDFLVANGQLFGKWEELSGKSYVYGLSNRKCWAQWNIF